MKGLTKRLVSQFKFELVGRILATLSGGLLMAGLARVLGPDEYGVLFLAIAVFGAFGVFSKLGIAKSCARYIAKYKEEDPSQVPHILRVSLAFNLITIGIVAIALAIGHGYFASLLDEPALTSILLIGVLYVVFEALATFTRLVLQGFEEIEMAAAVHALNRISRLCLAIGLVVVGFGLIGALVGYILSFVLSTVFGAWIIYQRFYRNVDPAASIESGLRRRIGEYTVPLTATSTANVLDKQIDTVLVGFFLNPLAVSYYVVGKQVIEFIETPVAALGFTLSPSFGAQKADDNVLQAARVYEEALTHALLLYIPAAAGLVLVADPAVELIFGSDYGGAIPVLQILAIYAVLQSITKITSNALDFLGRAKARATVKGITALLNVCLNIILIPALGVVGAAIATVITYSIYTSANVYIIHQEFNLHLSLLVHRVSLILCISGGMAGAVLLVDDHVEGWITLFGAILLGIVVWGTLSVLSGLLNINKISKI